MTQTPSAQHEDGRYSTGVLLRRLLKLAWQFRVDCVLSLALSVALLLLGLVGLQLLGTSIDVIRHALDPSAPAVLYPLGWKPPANWSALQIVTTLSVAIVALALLRSVMTYHYNMVTVRLTQGKIVPELRSKVYAQLQRLSFRFFETHGSGSIFNRLTGDTQNTRLFVDGVLLQGMNMLITLAAYFVFMWKIHPHLTLACLSFTIPLALFTQYYSNRLRPAYQKNRELYDDLVQNFSQSIHGIQTVKGFAAESERIRHYEEGNDTVSAQQQKIFKDLSFFTPITHVLSQVSLVILFAYGGWLYVNGRIPLGAGLVVFAGLLQQFTGQVANLSTIANSVQQSLTSSRRVFEVLDTPVEVTSKPDAIKPDRLHDGIKFENVTFGYDPKVPVLHEISFEAKPNQVIGIFGMTGAGKTSLLSLIPRFYDPQQGRILFDQVDLRDLSLDDYRRQIGIVYQESFLFSNTVAANIAFGNPYATHEEIEEAARAASAHDFIMAMSKGYQTVLGEAGVDLSGGQRQRLALARALLLKPSILILDDPTASVDPRTEHEIVTSLRHAMEGRTAFIVANRLSLLRRADKILVIEAGRIVQIGGHDELLHVPGPYHDAAMLQLMDIYKEDPVS